MSIVSSIPLSGVQIVTDPLKALRLLVVSHAPHYRVGDQLFAYGPYVREIDLWADLFDELVIAAPYEIAQPPGDYLAFEARNISVAGLPLAGGDNFAAKMGLAMALPSMLFGLARAMSRTDAIHVRCPGNVGLLGAILAPLFSRRLVAKYAAQWSATAVEPWSFRVQKALLRSSWWRGPVTVYGNWPDQPSHIVPFFTSLLDRDHMQRAKSASQRGRSANQLRVLYTGRVSKSKNVDAVLRAVAASRADGHDVLCTIVGEGPERARLQSLASELGLSAVTTFTGGVPFESVIEHLEQADVLVLTSETEGWPKSIAEGMAFGLVCIGSNRGFVPEMLSEGRGLIAEPGDAAGLAGLLSDIARNPQRYADMRRRAAEWARQFSMEGLKQAIHKLLLQSWKGSFKQAQPLVWNEGEK